MADMKDYVWVFPLIAGVLLIIAIVTPAVFMNMMGMATDNLWFWGLYAIPPYGDPVVFETELLVLIPSIITTALMAISAILLLYSGISHKTGRSDLSSVKTLSIVGGVLAIVGIILWLIMVPLFFPLIDYSYWYSLISTAPPGVEITFWSISYYGISIALHSPGFGIIGGFIGSGLALGGAGAAHYYSKERATEISEKEPALKEPTLSTEEEKTADTEKLIFCPECGARIEDPEAKFCGSCGKAF